MEFEIVYKQTQGINFNNFSGCYFNQSNNKNDIVDFVFQHREEFLESLYFSEIAKPSIVLKRSYRLLSPEFLNYAIQDVFKNNVIVNEEMKGKSYDWIIFNKKRDTSEFSPLAPLYLGLLL